MDVERSTDPLRTNPIKEELREHVYRLLHRAMMHAGIDPHHCDPFEDRGDGVLILVHPVDSIPKTHLLSRLIPELARLLAAHNLRLPPEERGRRELRLRAVVHYGEIHHDDNGCFGEAIDVAFRLLDSPRLKRCLRSSEGSLALVVSDDIYRAIVKHDYDGIRHATYSPELRVTVAGARRQGWVHLPPDPFASVRPLSDVDAVRAFPGEHSSVLSLGGETGVPLTAGLAG